MNIFFQTEKLTVGYDGKPVVRSIDISLSKGQILCLIGPNGSGKSTVLKSITKQLETISGVVTLGDVSLESITARQLSRRVSVVLTERPMPERMTCADVVAAGRYPYTGMLGILSGTDREKIEEAMTLTGALEFKDRDFSEISDGQLQRVMLARAICQEPEVLVLDEPTSFLDIRYALEMLDILRHMADVRGVTVIMSLHELTYANRVSDLVMCIKDGAVLLMDRPDVVFTEEIISALYDLPKGIYQQILGGL